MDIVFLFNLLIFFVVLGALIYVTFHSKRVWPDKNWFTRFSYIITFKKHPKR